MTLCAQYTDNMKKRTLAQNGTGHCDENALFYASLADSETFTYLCLLTGEIIVVPTKKPKRPRGKKVFSTDKGVKR